MKQNFYQRIGELVHQETLPNGLEIRVVPKPGYAKNTPSSPPGTAVWTPVSSMTGNGWTPLPESPIILSIRCLIQKRATPCRSWPKTARNPMLSPPTP